MALRPICVGRTEHGSNLVNANAQLVEDGGVHVHSNRGASAAPNKDLSHPLHLGELLRQDRIGSIVDARGRDSVRGERQNQNGRISRVHFPELRILWQVRRQLPTGSVDGSLYVAGGGINVAVQIKLQNDGSRPRAAAGGHLVDAGNAAELPLQGSGDSGSHGRRAGSGKAGVNLDYGKLHLRQRSYGQKLEGERARNQHRGRQQRGADGPLDEWGGNIHASVGRRRLLRRFFDGIADAQVGKAPRQPVKPQVNHRRGVKGKQLAEQQAAHNRDAQRPAQFRAGAGSQRQRQAAQQRRHGGHHDGTEAEQAGLKNGFLRRLAFAALRFQGEVNHHDGILFHDADQQDNSNQRYDIQVIPGQQQRHNGAHTRRGQRGKNRNGMDIALVEDAQHNVHRNYRGQNEPGFGGERVTERRRRSLETGVNAGRNADRALRVLNGAGGVAQRSAGSQVEGQGHHWKLPLVI